MSKMSIVSAVMLAVALMGGALAEECTTVLDYARTEPELSMLVAAIEAVNATDVFSDPTSEGTFFAPGNYDFNKLLESMALTETELLDDTDLVARVLSAHLVPGPAMYIADLVDGMSLETEDPGSYLTYTVSPAKVTIMDTESNTGGDAGVLVFDRPACNMVIHFIDSVLVPVDLSTAALNDESV